MQQVFKLFVKPLFIERAGEMNASETHGEIISYEMSYDFLFVLLWNATFTNEQNIVHKNRKHQRAVSHAVR